MKKQSFAKSKSFYLLFFLVSVTAIFVAVNIIVGGKLLTAANLRQVLISSVIPAFTAWGFGFLFASNITDFSVGAASILGATAAGTLGNMWMAQGGVGLGILGVVLGGVLTTIVLMVINSLIFRYTKIPSWIAGMGMCMIYESISLIYFNMRLARGMQVVTLEVPLRAAAKAPWIFIILAIGLFAAYILYNRTSLGLNIRAAGSNPDVTHLMGVNVPSSLMLGSIIAGCFIGVAAFLSEAYNGRMTAVSGLTSISTIFQPIAAVLLAQAMQKFMNLMVAIPISTFLIMLIFNTMTMLGVPSGTWQQVALGAIVVVFGIIAGRGTRGVVK